MESAPATARRERRRRVSLSRALASLSRARVSRAQVNPTALAVFRASGAVVGVVGVSMFAHVARAFGGAAPEDEGADAADAEHKGVRRASLFYAVRRDARASPSSG